MQWVFRGCSRSLKGIHTHSMTFRGCLILTQRCSHTVNCAYGLFNSHTNAFFFMATPRWVTLNDSQWHPRTLNGCSHSLNGIHAPSMVFRGCSHSLIGIRAYLMCVQGLFTITQMCSCALNSIQGVFNTHLMAFSLFTYQRRNGYVFKHVKHAKALSISVECSSTFLFFGFSKQEEGEIMTSHLSRWLVGGLGVSQWDWQQK
jgi:hypothetical protein